MEDIFQKEDRSREALSVQHIAGPETAPDPNAEIRRPRREQMEHRGRQRRSQQRGDNSGDGESHPALSGIPE